MPKTSINGLALFFSAEEQNSAELIQQACERSVRLIQENWGLDIPKDCRIYVMTSWFGFVFQSAPWPWRILLALTLPLWAMRAQQTWALAGGWEQRYGQRRAVGIKPARILQLSDKRLGDRIFVKEANIDEKLQSITCHELTHAFTSHLRLPAWLKEGLAMVVVDRFFDKPTVQYETLAVLEHSSDQHNPDGYQKLRLEDERAVVYLYARSYWLTRYIEETRPGLLRDLLSHGCPHNELENRIARAYEKSLEEFWEEIDEVLVSYFRQKGEVV
jgi:hypothetical protein